MFTPETIQTFKEAMLQRTTNWKLTNILTDVAVDIPVVVEGVYDITWIEFISINPTYKIDGPTSVRRTDEELAAHTEKVVEFMTAFPDCVLADAYQTEEPFLLARKPRVRVNYMWSGFNYWANNIIPNCPTSILIVAQDD